MHLLHWIDLLATPRNHRQARSRCRKYRTRSSSFRPQVEALELRTLLSVKTFVVTNNSDNGVGSLRQAILAALAGFFIQDASADRINNTEPLQRVQA